MIDCNNEVAGFQGGWISKNSLYYQKLECIIIKYEFFYGGEKINATILTRQNQLSVIISPQTININYTVHVH